MTDTYVTFTAKLRPNMAAALDAEAAEIGISRMALIQVILHQHLKEQAVASESLAHTENTAGFEEDILTGFKLYGRPGSGLGFRPR